MGHIEIEKITPLHLQTLYSNKLHNGKLDGTGGLSGTTVRTMHRVIHSALEKAVKWKIVVRNVADSVEPPKAEKFEAKFLDENQTNLLIEKAQGAEIYIPVLIGVYTGMRRGEVLRPYMG